MNNFNYINTLKHKRNKLLTYNKKQEMSFKNTNGVRLKKGRIYNTRLNTCT